MIWIALAILLVICSPFIWECILIVVFFMLSLYLAAQAGMPRKELMEKFDDSQDPVVHDVVSKSDQIVGYFQGKPIFEMIMLGNGSIYEYESILCLEDGVTRVPDIKRKYVTHEGLLYVEVKLGRPK
jgi:hypothetical protein